jgi:23S rRNA (adenine-N6)-dimethyltransferase
VYKRRSKRKELGQNFLRDKRLAQRLVGMSSITAGDAVYEIGPGRGILTAALASRCARLTAVEFDPALVQHLRLRFRDNKNVNIVKGDFLRYQLREKSGYKIFASLPFGITSRVMQKLLYERPLPDEIFLILQREAAEKYSGLGRRGETVQSVLAKVQFEFKVLYRLRRDDFWPVPAVDSLLISIKRRKCAPVSRLEQASFEAFVRRGFCSWRKSLRLAMKRDFSYKRWKRLARDLKFALNAPPSEIAFDQWMALFRARSVKP